MSARIPFWNRSDSVQWAGPRLDFVLFDVSHHFCLFLSPTLTVPCLSPWHISISSSISNLLYPEIIQNLLPFGDRNDSIWYFPDATLNAIKQKNEGLKWRLSYMWVLDGKFFNWWELPGDQLVQLPSRVLDGDPSPWWSPFGLWMKLTVSQGDTLLGGLDPSERKDVLFLN